jgi:mono/diheme cytochrome c family protein
LDATAATINQGRVLYDTFCFSCHGVGVVAGALPDLRYATAEVHRSFDAIVLRGERQSLGMPSFGDLLSTEQARAIQAYVLARAGQSATLRPR